MPANLSPEYKAAHATFREARDPNERLHCLREMLRVIPKHKGTDHLQADIKRRIHELAEEIERPKKGGARGGPTLVVPARRRGSDRIAGSAECRQVDLARTTHRLKRACRRLSLHHTISGTRNDAVSGRALSARRPASRVT